MRTVTLIQPHTDAKTGITHQPGEQIEVEDDVARWLVSLYVAQRINRNIEVERAEAAFDAIFTKQKANK